jgi:hypothetical protein
LFRLLERGPTLSSSPRLASWGLTRGGLPARCALGRNGFAKARRHRAGSTGRRADKEDDRPRGNPEGRRAWGASLRWASSPMTPRRLLVPPRDASPGASGAPEILPGSDPCPQASCARPTRVSQPPVGRAAPGPGSRPRSSSRWRGMRWGCFGLGRTWRRVAWSRPGPSIPSGASWNSAPVPASLCPPAKRRCRSGRAYVARRTPPRKIP